MSRPSLSKPIKQESPSTPRLQSAPPPSIVSAVGRLEPGADYHVWAIRVQLELQQRNLWDNVQSRPLPEAHAFLASVLSDSLLYDAVQNGANSARRLWTHVRDQFVHTTIGAQATAFQALQNFRYSPTVAASKSELGLLKRDLLAAFQKPEVSISELVLLIALVHLPPQFRAEQALFQAKQLDATDSSASSTADQHLDALLASLASAESTMQASQVQQVQPLRSPDIPHCTKCHRLGYRKYRHREGSRFCQSQNRQKPPSAQANTAIQFNVDSGATDTILSNKGDQLYSRSPIHHPIRTANNSLMHATAIGSLHGPMIRLSNVLACPAATENLLSVGQLANDGFDTLFTKGKVLIGRTGRLSEVVLAGTQTGTTYHVDFPTSSRILSASSNEMHLRMNHLHHDRIRAMHQSGVLRDLHPDAQPAPCHSCAIAKQRHGHSPQQTSSRARRPGELLHTDLLQITPASQAGHTWVLTFTCDYSRYVFVYFLRHKSETFSVFRHLDARLYNLFQRHVTTLRSDQGLEYTTQDFSDYCSVHGIKQEFTATYSPSQNGVSERLNLTLANTVRAMLVESGLPHNLWEEALRNAVTTKNLTATSKTWSKTPYELFHGSVPSSAHLQIFGRSCYALTTPYDRRSASSFKLADRGKHCRFLGYAMDAKAYRLLTDAGTIIESRYEDVYFPKDSIQYPVRSPPPGLSPANVPEAQSTAISCPQSSIQAHEAPSTPATPDIQDDSDTDTSDYSEPALSPSPMPEEALNPDAPDSPVHTESTPSSEEEEAIMSAHPQYRRTDRPGIYRHPTKGLVTLEPASDLAPRDIKRGPVQPKRARPPVNYSEANAATTDSVALQAAVLTTEDMLNLTAAKWERLPAEVLSAAADPIRYEDIAATADSDAWYKATDAEIATLMDRGTWELVPLPKGRQAIKSKWVFRIKRDADGSIIKYKARLCACGYSQRPGIDYKAIYAPVVRTESLRLFLAIAAARDMDIHQMDVTSAFLNGELDETVYMRQPPGYTDPAHPNHVCLLHRNLYGLKQAPRVWHRTLTPVLLDLGFTSIPADPCIFVKSGPNGLVLISLYVDDLAIAADNTADLHQTKQALRAQFKMTDEGSIKFILGIKIRRDRPNRAIYLSNGQYIQDLLKDFNMLTALPVTTPMECKTISSMDSPKPNSDEWQRMQNVPYRQCVGRLTYLMRTTRPDLAFSVSLLSRYLHNPGERHWNLCKRVMRYLHKSVDYELRLAPKNMNVTVTACDRSSPIEGPLRLSGNVDSDWAGSDAAKSTTGYTFFLGSAPIAWSSKAQPVTATSSTMAEYMAAYSASTECIWARSFLKSLNLLPAGNPTTIYCDNAAVISLSEDHMVNPRSKHFDTKYHYLREQVTVGEIQLKHCPGNANVADALTKPLRPAKFQEYCRQLGLTSVSDPSMSKACPVP